MGAKAQKASLSVSGVLLVCIVVVIAVLSLSQLACIASLMGQKGLLEYNSSGKPDDDRLYNEQGRPRILTAVMSCIGAFFQDCE